MQAVGCSAWYVASFVQAVSSSIRASTSSMFAVASSMWYITSSTQVVASSVRDVVSSLWAVTPSACDSQVLYELQHPPC